MTMVFAVSVRELTLAACEWARAQLPMAEKRTRERVLADRVTHRARCAQDLLSLLLHGVNDGDADVLSLGEQRMRLVQLRGSAAAHRTRKTTKGALHT